MDAAGMKENVLSAFYKFFSSFGIPAYISGNIPDDAKMPYITYAPVIGDWESHNTLTVNIYYKSTSYAALFDTTTKIMNSVKRGELLNFDGGKIFLNLTDTVAQFPATEDPSVKQAFLLLDAQTIID